MSNLSEPSPRGDLGVGEQDQRVEQGGRRLGQELGLRDLVPLSISSVGPLFSVAATGGVMAAQAGWWTLPAIGLLAVPFVIASFIFRLLNQHFPHSGASYHWSARVMGRGISRYQAWILIVAYFTSIPPIAIPAASYTLALIAPRYKVPGIVELLVVVFWIAFAAIPLLAGSRPTARITRIFFILEMASLAVLGFLGVLNWKRIGIPIHFGKPPIAGILVVAVIAATILDGWEIDSYAAEESYSPRTHPGVGGILGAFGALLFYAILYPLILGETPIHQLANASNPLSAWSTHLIPSAPWIVLIPILLSTAGGLWLTTFILTRALYAMGRERLIPGVFSKLSRRNVPHAATLITLGCVLGVTTVQTLVSGLGSFFQTVLSAAGFFLLMEFFMDSLTATVFLARGHRKTTESSLGVHRHRVLLIGAIFSSVIMGTLLITFMIVAPRVLGSGIDGVIFVFLLLGVLFAWITRRRDQGSISFDG